MNKSLGEVQKYSFPQLVGLDQVSDYDGDDGRWSGDALSLTMTVDADVGWCGGGAGWLVW